MNNNFINLKPTKKHPVKRTWIKDNQINIDSSTILNFTNSKNNTIIQDNNPFLIDTSKTKPSSKASELFLIKRDNQKYFSWLSLDHLGNLIIRSIGNNKKGFVEIPEMIFNQDIEKELEIIGKAFPLNNMPKTKH